MERHLFRNILISCLISSAICYYGSPKTKISPFNLPNLCIEKDTCSKCMQTLLCAWCYDPINNSETPRCYRPLPNETCPDEFTINLDNELKIVQAEPVTNHDDVINGNVKKIVQLSPQKINLKLRKDQPQEFHMTYRQVEDYPIDVYYLLDARKSVHYGKENISNIATNLVHTLKKLTTNFRIGFGSFFDKSGNLEKDRGDCQDCPPPFGFKHERSLSSDTEIFLDAIKKTEISENNSNNSEGFLDALLQAGACQQDIGWSKGPARRVIVFSTGTVFKKSRDEKLESMCHLSSNGFYHPPSVQHPSTDQLSKILGANEFNVIFASTEDVYKSYRHLPYSLLKNHADIANVTNIEKSLKDQYNTIDRTIEIKHNASEYVKINFFSTCNYSCGSKTPVTSCSSVKAGEDLHFDTNIEVTKCPKDPVENHQIIEIFPVGINESLIIDLEMLCHCNE